MNALFARPPWWLGTVFLMALLGLWQAASALILAVVTEMQASLPGLGSDIFQAQRAFRSPELYSGLIVLGVLGFLLNHVLQLLERRLLRWRNPHN